MTSNNSQHQKYIEVGETIRGRYFLHKDIEKIKQIVEKFFKNGRTRASVEICRALNWKQPNGWLKDRACRDVLLTLERKGYLTLPPRKSHRVKKGEQARPNSYCKDINESLTSHIDLGSLRLVQVKGTKDEPFWNWLVNKFHYLGFKVLVGRSLKYLIYSQDRVLGAIGWCDPAWTISARDTVLEDYLGIDLAQIRFYGVNNGRFLILPWITVPNLASHLLSLAVNMVVNDWASYYSVTPLFLETFVDPTKFRGTCYKAANWIFLGKTRGYLKKGQSYQNSQKPKMLFVYPVDKKLRQDICNYMKGNYSD